MSSPACEVQENAGSFGPTTDGVNVSPGSTITIRLADSNVDQWEISCASTDDTNVASTVQAGLTIDSMNKTASFTAPAAGSALRFRSRIQGGLNPNGTSQTSYTTTFCIYTLVNGYRVIASDETTEGGAFGWVKSLNDVIRAALDDTSTLSLAAERIRKAQLQTTDDTQATLLAYTMSDESVAAFDVVVTAVTGTNATGAGRWKRSVVYRRTGAGVATIVGAIETGTDQETDAAWDVDIDTDGANDVRVRVTGAAATDINWAVVARVQESFAT